MVSEVTFKEESFRWSETELSPLFKILLHPGTARVVRPRPSRDDSTMTNSRQRKRTTANKHRDNTNETTKMRKGHAQAVTMSEVAVSLIIAAIIILSILLYWWNTSTREDTKTNNRMTESINNKYKHPMQEDSGARETDNEQEHSRSSQSTQSVSFSQQYDSLSDDIDRDMLPSDPSEDPMDFDDHASFTGSFDQQNKLTHLDNFPEKSRKPPQYLKRDWWVDVIEKIEGREHIKLHSNPDVYEVPNFLTIGECYELIKAYERLHRRKIEKPSWCFSDEMWLNDVMHASKIKKYEVTQSYDEDQGHMCVEGEKVSETFPKQLKYSSAVLLPRGEDMHVDQVEFKVGQWGLPTENAYHTQLLKYRGNEEYQPHTDCHNHSNDRMGTILIYLNDVKEGGETVFTALNISVSPKRGTAIIWKSLDADGKCDKRTLHASAVLKSGMKYVYQKWFHQMQLLPQYDSDNVLCDNSRSCREYIHSPETRQATTKMLEAETLVSSKRFKEALTLYQEAIKIQPNHSMSLVYGADVLMRLGRKHEALHWFQKALKLHPRHVDSNFITANILQEQNKLGLALQHLEVVVEMSPQDSDAFFNLGAMYADTERQEEAVVMLQKVVQLSPNDAEAHGELGALLSDMGKEDEAEVHYAKAKELMKQRRKKKRQ